MKPETAETLLDDCLDLLVELAERGCQCDGATNAPYYCRECRAEKLVERIEAHQRPLEDEPRFVGCRVKVCTCHDRHGWTYAGSYPNGCSQCGCQRSGAEASAQWEREHETARKEGYRRAWYAERGITPKPRRL